MLRGLQNSKLKILKNFPDSRNIQALRGTHIQVASNRSLENIRSRPGSPKAEIPKKGKTLKDKDSVRLVLKIEGAEKAFN